MKKVTGYQFMDGVSDLIQKVVKDIKSSGEKGPKMALVVVGSRNSEVDMLIKAKLEIAQQLGIQLELVKLPANVSQTAFYNKMGELNDDDNIHAISLQLPLPTRFQERDYLESIYAWKDADGMQITSHGLAMQGEPTNATNLAVGILGLLHFNQVAIIGAKVTILGAKNMHAKSLGLALMNMGATITFCNENITNIKQQSLTADILITATSRKIIVTPDMVKTGATVIDIGVMFDPITKDLLGDVDIERVKKKAGLILVPDEIHLSGIAAMFKNVLDKYLELQEADKRHYEVLH